jgi:hypothetical protein
MHVKSRLLFLISALLIAVGIGFLLPQRSKLDSPPQVQNQNLPPVVSSTPPPKNTEIPALETSELAANLNAKDFTIQRDLQCLNEIFSAWQTNFPSVGNPVGDNQEITKILCGDNRLRFAFIPPNHPAINSKGELCDRWGTPFFFHSLSANFIEIRSAGPDKHLYTKDDSVLSPGQP